MEFIKAKDITKPRGVNKEVVSYASIIDRIAKEKRKCYH